MKRTWIALLLVGIGIPIGWVLAGIGAGTATEADPAVLPAQRVTRAASGGPDSQRSSRPLPTTAAAVDLAELEGLAELNGRSPALVFKEGMSARVDALGKWLGLSAAETNALGAIIREVTERRIAWEQEHVGVGLSDDGDDVLLDWKRPADLPRELRAALDEAFGPDRGGAVWLKGDLGNFGNLPPGLSAGGNGVIRLAAEGSHVQASAGAEKPKMPDGVHRLPMARFDHLVDWDGHLAKRTAPSTGSGSFPVAEGVPGKPGFVISPISGKIIDVNDIPPGTLVRDPMISTEQGGIFRIPPATENE